MATFKQKIGCWCHERWPAELLMRAPSVAAAAGITWQDLCNRHERISLDPLSGGRVCHWQDSSPLTVSRMFPDVGARILRHVLRVWPVRFSDCAQESQESPEVSFVIGVRGTGRLPQFQATVASLLGQEGCPVQVVVVEQSNVAEFRQIVPSGVKYIHTPPQDPQAPFNRSWALNVGARHATGRVVVLHDGDYVVPAAFAHEIAQKVTGGVQAARLARYIFYLDQQTSQHVQSWRKFDDIGHVERIVQNNPTPVAVTRDAYLRIGGHDESFYGWGGEDNEFLDRVRTLNYVEGSFLPVIHLWHTEAPNRSGDRNVRDLQRVMAVSASKRIADLNQRSFGMATPSVQWPPASQQISAES